MTRAQKRVATEPTQQLELAWGPSARVRLGRGPIETERQLLADLEDLLPRGAPPPGQPVLLVVPSLSLRLHLLERITNERGRAVLGLECRTHHGFALSAIERAPQGAASGLDGADLLPLFARRLGKQAAPLRRCLAHLQDGFGAVHRPVRDLLEAGLESAHLEAAEEVLASEGPAVATGEAVERAVSLVRIAARSLGELEAAASNHSAILLRDAATVVRMGPPEALPASCVLVYGFNDATGVATDFLLALLERRGGFLYLDEPPDPADRSRPDSGGVFRRGFRERIETTLGRGLPPDGSPVSDPGDTAPELSLFRAFGGEAEVREVAERVSALLASGLAAERIGVVARDLAPYVGALRIQFGRLAIPFSGVDRIGPASPESRRLYATLELLQERGRLPLERWLEAANVEPEPAARHELLVALHVLGAGRLAEAAELDPDALDEGSVALPARRGFKSGEEDPLACRAVERRVPVGRIAAAIEAAKKTAQTFADWPESASAAAHRETLAALLDDVLMWRRRAAPDSSITMARRELGTINASLPAELEMGLDELSTLLMGQLRDSGKTALGGEGGGVQVLDVVAARSRTFEHLFLLGMNRGSFPLVVQDDALLADSLRQVLSRSGFGILPDLALKRSRFFEERYLFAQLLSSSPAVTLSWQEVDDQQNFRTVSPLLERLRLAAGLEEVDTARPVFSPLPQQLERRRPAHEAAVLAGLLADRPTFGQALAVALGETDAGAGAVEARLRVLDELDPLLSTREGARTRKTLGPYFGFVGDVPRRPDPALLDPRARERLPVTGLEGMARCPWKQFLQRMLWLEPLPDPLETFPGLDPLLVGQVVHDVLESIVLDAIDDPPTTWEEALTAPGLRVRWPNAQTLEALTRRRARAVVRRRRLALPGLDIALARAALPHLATAAAEDWPDGVSRHAIVAAEVGGSIELPDPERGEPRRILFRADRLDRSDAGPVLTDYKTGRHTPLKGSGADAGQRLLAGVSSGEWLQAAVYALAARSPQARGRYLFLNPGLDDEESRSFAVTAGDEELLSRFASAVSALTQAWDRGTQFPRFLDWRGDKEPVTCSFCDVSSACLRGDSGARSRLRDWVARRVDGEGGAEPTGAPGEALLAAWLLDKPQRKRR